MKKIILTSFIILSILFSQFTFALTSDVIVEDVTEANTANVWTLSGTTWPIAMNTDDSDTEYGYHTSNNRNLVMNMSDTTGTGSIANITVKASCRLTTCAGACGEGGNIRLYIGAVYYDANPANDWTTSYVNYSDVWINNPVTTNSWQWGEIAEVVADVLSTKSGAEATDWRCTYIEMAVYYYPALDTTFLLMMPQPYSGSGYEFVSEPTEGGANETSWISFNFTAADLGGPLVEPCTSGNCALNQQQGSSIPIFYIDNLGNVKINIDLRLNESQPGEIRVYANATCSGTCSSTQTSLINLTDSYQRIVTGLVVLDSFANITLYANESGASAGEWTSNILTNSTNTTN